MEKWRPVTGYEGLYEVSDQGQVRSLDRVILRSNGVPMKVKGRVLQLKPGNKHDHLKVTLVNGSEQREVVWVHRLVALEWCERLPGQDVVLHGKEGPTVNRADHLRWGTYADNYADMAVHDTLPVYVPPDKCLAGHPMTPENVYVPPKRPNERRCRECQRIRERRFRRSAK